MRIIDNRKDFYDYNVGIYDTDDSVVYVRKTQVYKDNITDDNFILNKVKDNLKNYIPIYMNKYISKIEPNQIYIEHLIVGIYPYVYIIPYIVVIDYDKYSRSGYVGYNEKHIIPMPLDIYTNENKIIDYYLSKYPEDKNIKFKIHTYSSNTKSWNYNRNNFVQDNIIKSNFRFENKDLFEKIIKAPTFIYIPDNSNNQHYGNSVIRKYIMYDYSNSITTLRHEYTTKLIINPVFKEYQSMLLNPIMDILNNTPIYNDIENFLWAVKQEPISEPDNKTKIINHGFDLKTSFRKM